ncbi:MAG: malto-oligosyltrehalose trehalohydrolase [Dehalococcoidia bacterium]
MTVFRVWAPRATAVAVEIAGERTPLFLGAGDWWVVDLPGAGPGTDYAFVVDGGPLRPDPRSPWQPYGVDGPSRLTGPFAWTDSRWQSPPFASAVVYELHIGTFTPAGDFDSAIDRLADLVALGITHVELMPVAQFSGERGWGYDGVDLFAPHQGYGGPDGLKRLVDACHAHGLAVILDVVYNHLGPAGNYLAGYGPYFTDRYSTPWGEAVNFDGPDSDEVRRFFIDNALMWLREYHIDGLRLDAVHAIVDISARHILEHLAIEVEALRAETGRHVTLIAESDLNDPRLLWSRERGGYGLDAQWNDDFHHALHTVLTGEDRGYYQDFGTLAALAKALGDVYVYDGGYSAFRRRRHGRPASGLAGSRFVGFLQNHDQVGNRATGERSSRLMSEGRLKVGAALVLTAPFVPLLFQGEEWGASTPFQYFTDHQDPALGRAVTEGRRGEFAAFGWKPDQVPDPQSLETFLRSKLDWAERERAPHAGLLEWHRALIRLRRTEPALSDGRREGLRVDYDEAARWLTLSRGPVVVACNLGPAGQAVPLGAPARMLLLASDDAVVLDGETVTLPPDSVAIFRR